MSNKELHFALEKKLCEMSFYDFFKKAWHIVEPSIPLSTNWHHKYLCDTLQKECERIIEGKNKTKDIIVNVPFRSTKSLLVTVMFPVWCWIKDPTPTIYHCFLLSVTINRTRNKEQRYNL